MPATHREGLKVPAVIAADPTGADMGDGVPKLLVTYLPGQPLAAPDVHRLAEAAASIHSIAADDFDHDFFPWYRRDMTSPPSRTAQPEMWVPSPVEDS